MLEALPPYDLHIFVEQLAVIAIYAWGVRCEHTFRDRVSQYLFGLEPGTLPPVLISDSHWIGRNGVWFVPVIMSVVNIPLFWPDPGMVGILLCSLLYILFEYWRNNWKHLSKERLRVLFRHSIGILGGLLYPFPRQHDALAIANAIDSNVAFTDWVKTHFIFFPAVTCVLPLLYQHEMSECMWMITIPTFTTLFAGGANFWKPPMAIRTDFLVDRRVRGGHGGGVLGEARPEGRGAGAGAGALSRSTLDTLHTERKIAQLLSSSATPAAAAVAAASAPDLAPVLPCMYPWMLVVLAASRVMIIWMMVKWLGRKKVHLASLDKQAEMAEVAEAAAVTASAAAVGRAGMVSSAREGKLRWGMSPTMLLPSAGLQRNRMFSCCRRGRPSCGVVEFVVVAAALAFLPASRVLVMFGAHEVHDQPWLAVLTAIVAVWMLMWRAHTRRWAVIEHEASVAVSKDTESGMGVRDSGLAMAAEIADMDNRTKLALYFMVTVSSTCALLTVVRLGETFMSRDEVLLIAAPTATCAAVGAVTLMLPSAHHRGRIVSVLLRYMLPVTAIFLMVCSYLTRGDVLLVMRIFLLSHPAGFEDLTCAVGVATWSLHKVMGTSLREVIGQLVVSLGFFLLISVGYTSELGILNVACIHAVLLILSTATALPVRSVEADALDLTRFTAEKGR
jgi:hypothetical protein